MPDKLSIKWGKFQSNFFRTVQFRWIGESEDKYRNSGKFIENLAELIVLNFPMILKARLQVKYIIYILVIIILSDQTL